MEALGAIGGGIDRDSIKEGCKEAKKLADMVGDMGVPLGNVFAYMAEIRGVKAEDAEREFRGAMSQQILELVCVYEALAKSSNGTVEALQTIANGCNEED